MIFPLRTVYSEWVRELQRLSLFRKGLGKNYISWEIYQFPVHCSLSAMKKTVYALILCAVLTYLIGISPL